MSDRWALCPGCGEELTTEAWTAPGVAWICLKCMALIPFGEEKMVETEYLNKDKEGEEDE